jgi:hypothetical protein
MFRRFHCWSSLRRGDNISEKERKKLRKRQKKTGEMVEKGQKKGFGVVKAFGKGAKEAIAEKKEKEKSSSSGPGGTRPQTGSSPSQR